MKREFMAELLKITFGSKDPLFLKRSSSTLSLISFGMFSASKVAMSSLTPLFARKLKLKHITSNEINKICYFLKIYQFNKRVYAIVLIY